MANPNIQQGNLNKVLTAVYPADFPALAITAPFMSRSMARIAPEGAAVNQIATGVGVVNSPEPFQFVTITVGLLRPQALANAWWQKLQEDGYIGDVNVHGDSGALDVVTVNDVSIQNIDFGAFDGQDPTVNLTLRGIVQINSVLWNAL